MPRQVVLKFPVELPKEGAQDKQVLKKSKETMVLELLRKGKISQGKASELLGIDRHALFDLMAEHDIPMANFPPEELERQRVDAAKRKQGGK
ncbi:MAG: hypothetical protein A2W05_03775 [Candidatus Schekmanbacteria bacterium RBG_16_38_10]|uniref:Uncharacterized protein n=1 Tax=Candidatus Schekmanbacteria bacterium RBG_16_38_10 TaxID=1817879 RepID=A0A1F7S2J0_9BACT|nr:MAG: hypothetical protein A2W05_03775 [Candidatus Schekmanbacteria bacterium RBG_16_38_10]